MAVFSTHKLHRSENELKEQIQDYEPLMNNDDCERSRMLHIVTVML